MRNVIEKNKIIIKDQKVKKNLGEKMEVKTFFLRFFRTKILYHKKAQS